MWFSLLREILKLDFDYYDFIIGSQFYNTKLAEIFSHTSKGESSSLIADSVVGIDRFLSWSFLPSALRARWPLSGGL
jgi:hypothetical protein